MPFHIVHDLPPESFGKLYLLEDDEKRKFTGKTGALDPPSEEEEFAIAREMVIHQFVHSPCVIEYITECTISDRMFHVLEFCNGGDLSNYLADTRCQIPTPESTVLQWACTLLEGLQSIHSCGVVHRNLSPSNVYLHNAGNRMLAKIGDFGMSCSLRELNGSFRTGSVRYHSPELIARSRCGFGVDLWSLGCILYEVCAFHHPFETLSYDQLTDAILHKSVARLPGGYSDFLQDLIEQMLQKQPDHRPAIGRLLEVPQLRRYL